MNDNAKALVAALRSGDYKQGTSTLTYVDSEGEHYDCCLGVACKLAVEAGVIQPGQVEHRELVYYDGFGGHENAVLPESVRAWLGFRTRGASFATKPDYLDEPDEQLSALNDSGKTFEEIAAIIESKPDGLFE